MGENAGAVYVYCGSSSGPVLSGILFGFPGDFFGSSVAGLGDLNGDGFDDFAVVASSVKANGIFTPTVLIFFGSADGILNGARESATADIQLIAASNKSLAVGSAGDLDQNGIADVFVGSPAEGLVYIFLAGGALPNTTQANLAAAEIVLSGPGDFGGSAAAAGDVNGQNEGLAGRYGDDLLLGSPAEGKVWLVLGQSAFPSGLSSIENVAAREFAGVTVGGVGDFDGNGVGDIAIGDPSAGEVTIYLSEPFFGPQVGETVKFTQEAVGDQFGFSIGGFLPLGLGGSFPLVVGAPENGFSGVGVGSAYLMSRSIFGDESNARGGRASASLADTIFRSPFAGDGSQGRFGSIVRAGLDLNGDGSGDLMIGAPNAQPAGENSGAVYLAW